MRLSTLLPALVAPLVLLACSGNAVVEPGAQSSKRAKLAIEKCEPPSPPDGTSLKEVYACFEYDAACPEAGDAVTKEELSYLLNRDSPDCEEGAAVFDVPCGPDLNAPVDCCYVARTQKPAGCQ